MDDGLRDFAAAPALEHFRGFFLNLFVLSVVVLK